MSTADTVLRRVALALSIVLVLLLSALALVSVFDAERQNEAAQQGEVSPLDEVDTDPDDEPDANAPTEEDPASAAALYQGEGVRVDSDGAPLSLSCRSAADGAQGYIVVAENLGQDPRDFLVAVDLVSANGRRVEAVAQASGLLPSESRQLALETGQEDPGSVEGCVITAVQQDRQVLLTGQ